MEFELNPDGSIKLDENGNPIPKQAPAPTEQQPAAGNDIPEWLVAVNAANNAAAAANARQAELEARLAAIQQQQHQPQPVQLQEGDLYNNPNKLLGAIENLMQQQVAPLRQFQQKYERDAAYQQMKNHYKLTNPNVARALLTIEPLVDQEMANRPVNEGEFLRAIQFVVGGLALTNPGLLQPQQPPVQNNQLPAYNQPNNQPVYTPPQVPQPINQNTLPPHLRSNASHLQVVQGNQSKVDPNAWDENKRRLWRVSGMSAEDYEELSNCLPNQLEAKYREINERNKQGGKK